MTSAASGILCSITSSYHCACEDCIVPRSQHNPVIFAPQELVRPMNSQVRCNAEFTSLQLHGELRAHSPGSLLPSPLATLDGTFPECTQAVLSPPAQFADTSPSWFVWSTTVDDPSPATSQDCCTNLYGNNQFWPEAKNTEVDYTGALASNGYSAVAQHWKNADPSNTLDYSQDPMTSSGFQRASGLDDVISFNADADVAEAEDWFQGSTAKQHGVDTSYWASTGDTTPSSYTNVFDGSSPSDYHQDTQPNISENSKARDSPSISDYHNDQTLYGVPEQFSSNAVPSNEFPPAPDFSVIPDDGRTQSIFPAVIGNELMSFKSSSDFESSSYHSRILSDGDSELNGYSMVGSTFQTGNLIRSCATVLPTLRQSSGTHSVSEPPTPATQRRRPANPPPPPPTRSTPTDNEDHRGAPSSYWTTKTLPRNHKDVTSSRQRHISSSALIENVEQSLQCRVNGSIASSNDSDYVCRSTTMTSSQVKDIRAALLGKIPMHQSNKTSAAERLRVTKGSFADVKRGSLSSSSMLSSLSVSSLPAAVLSADVEPRRSPNNAGSPPEPPIRGSSCSPGVEPRNQQLTTTRNFDDARSSRITFNSFRGSMSSTTDLTDISAESRGAENGLDYKTTMEIGGSRLRSALCRSVIDLTGSRDDDDLSSWILDNSRSSRRDGSGSSGGGRKPVAQIRPHAIRAPTAAATYGATKYGRQKSSSTSLYNRDSYVKGENEINSSKTICTSGKETYTSTSNWPAKSEETSVILTPDDQISPTSQFDLSGSGRRSSTCSSNTGTLTKFGSLRSKIKDYLSAAATGVGNNRKSTAIVLPTSSSSISISTRSTSTRKPSRKSSSEFYAGRHRENSPVTKWRPDTEDYAAAGTRRIEPELLDAVEVAPSTSVIDPSSDSSSTSCSDRWTTFTAPRPYSSPRRIASHVSVPSGLSEQLFDNIATTTPPSNSSASSFGDVTSSISSRITTFLTFLGRSGCTPSANVLPTSLSIAGDLMSDSGIDSNVENHEDFFGENSRKASGSSDGHEQYVSSPEGSTFGRHRSPSADAPEMTSLGVATLGRSRSVTGAQTRRPIRFVRESHQVLSTFSAATESPAGQTATSTFSNDARPTVENNKYRAFLGGKQESGMAYRSLMEQLPSQRCNEEIKYNSSSVSKYEKQRSSSTPPRNHPISTAEDQTTTMTTETDQSTGNTVSSLMTSSRTFRHNSSTSNDSTSNDGCSESAVRTSTNQRGFIGHVTFGKFDSDVDRLVRALNDAATSGYQPSPSLQSHDAATSRENLLALTRRFVSDSQRMVSSAVGPSAESLLPVSVEDSLSTLSAITNAAIRTASEIGSQTGLAPHQQSTLASPKAIILLGRVRDMVETYRSTVWTARSAAGQPFDSVEMKALVTQATSLAAMLGSLIRMLSRVD